MVEEGQCKITKSSKSTLRQPEPIEEDLLMELYQRCTLNITLPNAFGPIAQFSLFGGALAFRHLQHLSEGTQAWFVDHAMSTSPKFLLSCGFRIRYFGNTNGQVSVRKLVKSTWLFFYETIPLPFCCLC